MKIILATDGTKHTESAVEMVKNFNLNANDEIHIIFVIDIAVPLAIDIYAGYLPSITEIKNSVNVNADKILELTRKAFKEFFSEKNILIFTEVLHGSPENRIVETAEEIKANLIIVGSLGYKLCERLLLGSISDSVIHHAPCSVLVVKNSVN